ncbi:MAG: DNA cytosine methyltransferase [Dysgonamonadaceae bacterium]|jgi:DNA (cytosine-5)-methyltransferase 1|nr:DNA cytosine methyltransferase [Dysgonamonadaceae bacterium]
MDIKEKISIEEYSGKLYKMRVFEPNDNNEAVLTHFIKNHLNGDAKFFKEDAIKATKKILEYKYPDKKITLQVAEQALQYGLFDKMEKVPFPSPDKPKFKFIDLFAGIGGFRIAMQNLGGQCIYTSEWDLEAQKTYKANYGEIPFGDITKEETKKYIPDNFDILCAGFPCQAFSIAGKRKGFEENRGVLFFDVAEIIRRKQPKAFFLENVKGLLNHDKGRTIEVILDVLRNDLGYFVPEPQIMNAKDFGVPQNRERIYIVGFHKDTKILDFEYPKPTSKKVQFFNVKEENVVPTKYYLSTQYVKTLIAHKERHASKGNGFGYEIIKDSEVANAIVVGGMGRERNLVIDNRITDFTPTTHIKGEVNRDGWRRMTPREWARLQGFPDNFIIPVSDASAYKQFGNSVAVPAIQETAKVIINKLKIK